VDLTSSLDEVSEIRGVRALFSAKVNLRIACEEALLFTLLSHLHRSFQIDITPTAYALLTNPANLVFLSSRFSLNNQPAPGVASASEAAELAGAKFI
jgi:hypothetical protein